MNETLTLQLGHSPDPDDAFMFYGLAKERFPTGPYRFNHVLQDIQTLNQRAMRGELEFAPAPYCVLRAWNGTSITPTRRSLPTGVWRE